MITLKKLSSGYKNTIKVKHSLGQRSRASKQYLAYAIMGMCPTPHTFCAMWVTTVSQLLMQDPGYEMGPRRRSW